jgi:hypothetical protein
MEIREFQITFGESAAPQGRDLGTSRGSLKADLTRCDLRRDPGACFVAFDAWQRQLQVVFKDERIFASNSAEGYCPMYEYML